VVVISVQATVVPPWRVSAQGQGDQVAVAELGFGRGAATVAIVDGEPKGYLVHATTGAHKTRVVTAEGTR